MQQKFKRLSLLVQKDVLRMLLFAKLWHKMAKFWNSSYLWKYVLESLFNSQVHYINSFMTLFVD